MIIDENEAQSWLSMIEQSLHGVMFHNFKVDYYDLLGLCGFKKLHACQYKEENANLEELKHEYINKFQRIPVARADTANFWKEYQASDISPDTIPAMVKESLTEYYNWETGVLNNLLEWKKNCSNKAWFQKPIQEVMCEITRIETMMSILEEHDYTYDCINELSNYLYYEM